MRKHRLMLDYDDKTFEEVKADAVHLFNKYPKLGKFTISHSDQTNHWRVEFRKSELDWGTAISIAEESGGCDRNWLEYCKKYECFTVKTVVSKNRQPKDEVVNPPVDRVRSPFMLIVEPADSFNLRCCLRLCETIKDPEWVWREYIPLYDMRTRVQIGCRDESQAIRRMKWLSERVHGKFAVKEVE